MLTQPVKVLKKNRVWFKMAFVALMFFAVAPMWAQSAGSAALMNSANEIKQYWDSVSLIVQVIGGLVGVVGGLRVYNKWTNGDHDINKEAIGWAGACVFLLVVPTFINAMFQMS